MNNHIVTEPSKTIRALGRQTLQGNWGTALIVVLLGSAITSLPGFILGRLTDSSLLSMLIEIYSLLVTGPVNLGLAIFFLKMFRQQGPQINDLASGFDFFRNATTLYLSIMIRVFLMTLLFIIPGIIASIRYSQAYYILADDPNKPAGQCMYESAVMMEGNKAKYMWFNLSYIGWYILANMPQSAISMRYMPDITMYDLQEFYNTAAAIASNPLVTIAGLCTVFVTVYVSAGHAAFYDLVSGNLYVQQDPSRDVYY
ncbi:MAG: DUF975 family protein [Firmicutes bacterium]|nr:DUF975 family protein [Bacillota bacterium]